MLAGLKRPLTVGVSVAASVVLWFLSRLRWRRQASLKKRSVEQANLASHPGMVDSPSDGPNKRSRRDLDPKSIVRLWSRLSACGRLPPPPLQSSDMCSQASERSCDERKDELGSRAQLAEMSVLAWLGDFAQALACGKDAQTTDGSMDGIVGTLGRFADALPGVAQRSGAFFPRRAPCLGARTMNDGIRLTCDTYTSYDGTKLGVMFAHAANTVTSVEPVLLIRWGGNAEIAAEAIKIPPLRDLISEGRLRVLFVDFRGFGWSDGRPSLFTLRGDAASLWQALPTILQDHDMHWPLRGPLVLQGRSLGAQCALHLATLHAEDVDALILDSPSLCHWPMETVPEGLWTDLATLLSPLKPSGRGPAPCDCCRSGFAAATQQVRESAWLDPIDLLSALPDLSLLVVSGTEDECCPAAHIKQLFQVAASKDKVLELIEHVGHNDIVGSPKHARAMRDFLERVSKQYPTSRS